MPIPRIVLAGSSSACGKTMITAGIIRALRDDGYEVQPFKVGPDYIDPSYHWLASGRPCGNLDTFLFREEHVIWLFQHRCEGADLAVVEGVRGLYEGIGAVGVRGSTYHVSEVLNAPVVLIVDARSLTKSVAALVKGYTELEGANIVGVILNRIRSEVHYRKARRALVKYTDVKVLGYVPRDRRLKVEYRHLGLVPTPERLEEMRERLRTVAEVISEHVDLDALIDVAKAAGPLEPGERPWEVNPTKCRIAVAKDEAFNFYYPENLEALEENGAKLLEFSPVRDEDVPPDADALYIGGGYPELFARQLEDAESTRDSILELAESGAPIYAECGGFMYLCKELRWNEDRYRWVGVFDVAVEMTDRVQGLSYTIARAVDDTPVTRKGEMFKGHEFHYSRLVRPEGLESAYRIIRGQGWRGREGFRPKDFPNVLGTYVHVHAASHLTFATNFAGSVES
ncbi:cobyrinate a,c-diamide synthase [Methanopyrus sp.]